jgi:hypothetical protein
MDRNPFTADNSTGYTQEEMDALNEEFIRRWNGWDADVSDAQLFFYDNGKHMTEDDAITQFRDEVARR